MSTANVDAMVQAAIRAYRGGNKQEAHTLLEKATELDPMHEQAWMWMSAVVEDPDDQKVCLENVLYINPNNQNAKRGLSMLQGTKTSTQSTPAAKPSASSPQKNASPFSADDAYTVPTSSISGNFSAANQPSADEYDDWVSGLGLGSSDSEITFDDDDDPFESDNSFASVFSNEFDDDDGLDDDFDLKPGPASSSTAFSDVANDMFGFDDDVFEDDFEDDDFGLGSSPSSSFTDGPFTSQTIDFDDDDLLEPSRPTRDRPKAPASPMEAPPKPRSSPASPGRTTGSSGIFTDTGSYDSYDTGSVDVTDPEFYFKSIPADIRPTRVPGMKASAPTMMLLGIAVLGIANVAALVLLIMNLG